MNDRVAFLRNFVFGVEDSLVSTVGLLSGIAIAGMAREDIFVTGIVLIFVEAISMAAGSFLSEASAQEYQTHQEKESKSTIRSATIMFVSYFVSGFVPLGPYLLLPVNVAFPASIAASIVALALLGIFLGKVTKTRMFPNMLRMSVIGGLAIVVGIAAGALVS